MKASNEGCTGRKTLDLRTEEPPSKQSRCLFAQGYWIDGRHSYNLLFKLYSFRVLLYHHFCARMVSFIYNDSKTRSVKRASDFLCSAAMPKRYPSRGTGTVHFGGPVFTGLESGKMYTHIHLQKTNIQNLTTPYADIVNSIPTVHSYWGSCISAQAKLETTFQRMKDGDGLGARGYTFCFSFRLSSPPSIIIHAGSTLGG